VVIPVEKLSLRTRDIEEAIAAVGRVYCPHKIVPTSRVRDVDASLEVNRAGRQPTVQLKYSTPVLIEAGDFPNLCLMMTATSGAAEADQEDRRTTWGSGQTMPLSSGLETQLRFDQKFSQSSVRVDLDQLEQIAGGWLGYPLEAPIRFALRPFSDELNRAWQQAAQLIVATSGVGCLLPGAALKSLDEFMLSLLLHGHPHNYSESLRHPVKPAGRRLVLEAERLFRERAVSGTTVSDVAAELGVGLRCLQAGFREWHHITPSSSLKRARLEAAHQALRSGDETTSVTDVALTLGFVHLGRFSAAYKAAFNENPVSTLRRGRRSRN
jgi:AraC-like DNA-binding protein